MTTRMRLGMGMPLADVAALPVYGRGWRRRLALLSGLAQAAAVAPGNGEPATNGRRPERVWLLGRRWRPRQLPAAAFGSPAPPSVSLAGRDRGRSFTLGRGG